MLAPQAEQNEMNDSDMFNNGLLAMIPFGLWRLKPTTEGLGADAFQVVPMPKNKEKTTTVHNLGYVMSSKAPEVSPGRGTARFCAGARL